MEVRTMKFLLSIILATLLVIGLSGCFSDECDEPLLDYNQNGKEGDAGDYDIMRSVEKECRDGGF
jgi:hypothetical protein